MAAFLPDFDDYDQTADLGAVRRLETLVINGARRPPHPAVAQRGDRRARIPGAEHVVVARRRAHHHARAPGAASTSSSHALIDRAQRARGRATCRSTSKPAGPPGRHRRRQEAPGRARTGADGQRRRRPERRPERARCAEPVHAGAAPRGVVRRDGLPSRVPWPPPTTPARSVAAWARLLRAGDLVVLTGGLGAGKTTLTQGIGDGLGVRGPVTSPTFVIARVHPSTVGGPALVHVDAYRLGGALELDDLDLDAVGRRQRHRRRVGPRPRRGPERGPPRGRARPGSTRPGRYRPGSATAGPTPAHRPSAGRLRRRHARGPATTRRPDAG